VCQNCERVVLECRWPEVKNVLAGVKRERVDSVAAAEDGGDGGQGGGDYHFSRERARRVFAGNEVLIQQPCGGVGQHAPRAASLDADVRRTALSVRDAWRTASNASIPPGPYRLGSTMMSTSLIGTTRPIIGAQAQTPMAGSRLTSRPKAVLTQPIIDAHLDAYFTQVHPTHAGAFLHPPSVRLRVQTGRIDRRLLLSICAVSAPFTDPASQQRRLDAAEWAKEAKTGLILDCDMTLDTIAAALILAKYDINVGQYGSGWIFGSIANRMALALGLHRELPADEGVTQIERETRRRLFWACYCLDRMMSTGVAEFVTMKSDIVGVRLPMVEDRFVAGLPSLAGMIPPEGHAAIGRTDTGETGLLASYVMMVGMRFEVSRWVAVHGPLRELTSDTSGTRTAPLRSRRGTRCPPSPPSRKNSSISTRTCRPTSTSRQPTSIPIARRTPSHPSSCFTYGTTRACPTCTASPCPGSPSRSRWR